ncbi:MAG: glycosyltransferase family 9 protein [Candidatus Kapaibacterium sp.]|nr:glycosyltransferase family 9 protein [Ignavibacteriota bacterium]
MEVRLIDIAPNSNILIINTAFLGDIALTAFLTQKLKSSHNCQISVLTTKPGAEVLSPVKSIDSLFILDKKGTHKSIRSTIDFAKSLSAYNFDIIVSLHKSYRTSQIVKNIHSDIKIGFDNATNSRVYTHKPKYLNHLHEADRYISTIFEDFEKMPIELDLNIDDKLFVENLLLQNKFNENKKTVVLAPGSVWNTKKWGSTNYSDLANLLLGDYNVVVVGSKQDCLKLSNGVIDLCGKTTISQTYQLLLQSDVLVTNDSAPTHFASLTNTPTIAIFGATHPMFGFGPLAENSVVVQNESLKCRPCRVHGSESCPLGTHECMSSISPSSILKKIKVIIGS